MERITAIAIYAFISAGMTGASIAAIYGAFVTGREALVAIAGIFAILAALSSWATAHCYSLKAE